MARLIRVILWITVFSLLLFTVIFYLYVDWSENKAISDGILWVAGINAVIFVLLIIVNIANKRVALRLRTAQLYYNQLKAKMETEMAYSEVFAKINELTEVFSNTHDLEAVLNEAIKTLKDVLKVSILTLQLYSDDEDRFFLRIEEGATDIDLGDDIKQDVIEDGKSRLINELEAFKDYPELKEEGYTSLIVAPLTKVKPETGKTSIGLIAALTKERRDFTSQDLSLLTAFTRHASLIIQNAQLYMKTQEMAIRDGLTNLYNHRHFKNRLADILESAKISKQTVSLVISDIDFFKHYNDTHGHPQGDVILRQMSEIMLNSTRGSDIVARYGGEEFVIILPETEKEGAVTLCEIILNKIREFPFPNGDTQPNGQVTMTMGVATYPEEAGTVEELINSADERLYQGKNSGKNKVVFE